VGLAILNVFWAEAALPLGSGRTGLPKNRAIGTTMADLGNEIRH
jgi:hypothetical protein